MGFRDTLLKAEFKIYVEQGERRGAIVESVNSAAGCVTGRRCGRWDTDGTSCTWWRTWAPCSSCPTCVWTWAAVAGPLCGPWWGSWSQGCPAGSTGSWLRSLCTGSVSSGLSFVAHPASALSSSFVQRSACGHPSPSSLLLFSSWGLRKRRGADICSQTFTLEKSDRSCLCCFFYELWHSFFMQCWCLVYVSC